MFGCCTHYIVNPRIWPLAYHVNLAMRKRRDFFIIKTERKAAHIECHINLFVSAVGSCLKGHALSLLPR
jgi:hypothetical protein